MALLNRIRSEKEQQKSRRQTMLRAFKKNGELTTRDLNKFGTGCSSRLKELRKEGHKIVTTYIAPGQYRYVYLGDEDSEE